MSCVGVHSGYWPVDRRGFRALGSIGMCDEVVVSAGLHDTKPLFLESNEGERALDFPVSLTGVLIYRTFPEVWLGEETWK